MNDWIVQIYTHEYRVEAPTRWRAINIAVTQYKDETGSTQLVAVLMALARAYKIGRDVRSSVAVED